MITEVELDELERLHKAATPSWDRALMFVPEGKALVSTLNRTESLLGLDVDGMAVFAKAEDAEVAVAARNALPELIAAARPLEWTTELPAKMGWYWVYHGVAGKEVVHIFEQDGNTMLGRGGYAHLLAEVAKYFPWWAGPIPSGPSVAKLHLTLSKTDSLPGTNLCSKQTFDVVGRGRMYIVALEKDMDDAFLGSIINLDGRPFKVAGIETRGRAKPKAGEEVGILGRFI